MTRRHDFSRLVQALTANLTSQGLQRLLFMATCLKEQVPGGKNLNRICALEPMTHPQTADRYPDMADSLGPILTSTPSGP
jgi:hypothetical protein